MENLNINTLIFLILVIIAILSINYSIKLLINIFIHRADNSSTLETYCKEWDRMGIEYKVTKKD